MRRTILLAVASVWLAVTMGGAASAQPLPPGVSAADRTAIQGVIKGQLDAFKRDDAEGAYRYAAPQIKTMFPGAERFMGMVRQGYPPVYRSRSAEFSELAVRDGEVVQEVELTGPDGQSALAVYTMLRNEAGVWEIAGCALLPSVRVGT